MEDDGTFHILIRGEGALSWRAPVMRVQVLEWLDRGLLRVDRSEDEELLRSSAFMGWNQILENPEKSKESDEENLAE